MTSDIARAIGRIDIANSAYNRLFRSLRFRETSNMLSKLSSRIHAATISRGNSLVNCYISRNRNSPFINRHDVTDDGHYVNVRLDIPDQKRRTEVDYLIKNGGNIHVFEIKDGDTFDTKKSKSEIDSLLSVKKSLGQFNVRCTIVLWNCLTIEPNKFKHDHVDVDMMTGGEFWRLLGHDDYDAINSEREALNETNVRDTVELLQDIINTYLVENENS
jgi:hypothetical protein